MQSQVIHPLTHSLTHKFHLWRMSHVTTGSGKTKTVSTVQFVDVPEVMKTMRRRRSRQALGRFGPNTTTIISLFFRFSLVRLRQICKHYKSVELTIFLFIIGTYFHKQIDKSNSSQQFIKKIRYFRKFGWNNKPRRHNDAGRVTGQIGLGREWVAD